ncbi:MAG TPA: hypothetical protein VLY04_08990 [Bryobacteraceae bacterium]|nr:hypothetical protein [Bryobacteraceae bacterium]
MKLTSVVVFAVVVSGTVACMGQAPSRSNAAAAPAGLSVEDVIKLAKAGLSEDIILQQIKKRNRAFDLSTDDIIALKTAKVSDRIVAFMLDPSRPESAEPTPPESNAPAAPSNGPPEVEPRAAGRDSSVPAPAETASELPSEVGVYARKENRWVEVAPETVYWKTGGALRAMAAARALRGDASGHVLGVASHTSFTTPLELLIVAPEGVDMAEYQLVRLRPNKDNREFRIVTGGMFHFWSGAFRDMLSFDGKRVAGGAYEATFPTNAGPGEYGLLPPESRDVAGKIYSFRIEHSGEN